MSAREVMWSTKLGGVIYPCLCPETLMEIGRNSTKDGNRSILGAKIERIESKVQCPVSAQEGILISFC